MSRDLPVVWEADAHTIAKIEILKGYLRAWLRILGSTRKGQTILYVDGFAGAGRYRNHDEGSPLAALRVAQEAIFEMGPNFIAARIHGAFIESKRDRFNVLEEVVAPFVGKPGLGITKLCCEFAEGIELVRKEVPAPFRGEGPLFVFADPFGGTGIPFGTFAECMRGETAELLINLDADGIGRIFSAANNNREEQLTDLFGNESWRDALTARGNLKRLSVQILDLYKERLRSLPGVSFIWSFAMRGKNDALNYHLVFATKHPLGLRKMKEAMKAIDKTGSYSFSDAHVEQLELFREDNAGKYAERLLDHFDGQTVQKHVVDQFALTETPFLDAIQILKVLEKQQRVQVVVRAGESRRAGSFPDEKVEALRFGSFGASNAQGEFSL